MNRCSFLKTLSFTASGLAVGTRGGMLVDDKPIIIDGMGEIRLEYPMSLITEILKSGLNVISESGSFTKNPHTSRTK